VAMLAASAAGMADEADGAIKAAVARALVLRPTADGQSRESVRFGWFLDTLAAAAVRRPGQLASPFAIG
jgi:hypothetical protein